MKSILLTFLSLSFIYFPSFSQVRLIESQENNCDLSKDASLLKTRISNLTQNKDTSTVEVAFSAACAQEFVGFINFKNDTLNLCYVTPQNGPEVFCNCCYSIIYKIIGFKKAKHTILFNGENIPITNQEYMEVINKKTILADSTLQFTRIVDGKIESIVLRKRNEKIIRLFAPDGTLKRTIIKENF